MCIRDSDKLFSSQEGDKDKQYRYLEQEENAKNRPAENTAGDLLPDVTNLWCTDECKCVRGTVTAYKNKHTGEMVCHERPVVYNIEAHPAVPGKLLDSLHQETDADKTTSIQLPEEYPRHGAINWERGPGPIIGHQEELKKKLELSLIHI